MVVVAIIGILSAVAVPQFQKFQRKAKQTEARAVLSAIYTAEKIFLAETGTYYANLWAIGFEPEGLVKYNAGFDIAQITAVSAPGYTTGLYVRNFSVQISQICSTTFAAGLGKNCSTQNITPLGVGSASVYGLPVTTSAAFKSYAMGRDIDIGGSSHDIWSIDQRKELVNNLNGAL